MDFCKLMPSIDLGLFEGPKFCKDCEEILESKPDTGPAILALVNAFNHFENLDVADRDVTQAIFLRGEQRSKDKAGFDYDVALSFSGKDRQYVEQLADQLRANDIAVFYDKSEQADLWGKNLQTHLTELYRIRARYCVIIISASYVQSPWTKIELDAALAREFESNETYILPIRLDDTKLNSLLSTRVFIDARQVSLANIVALIKSKLALEKSVGFRE